MPKILSLLVSHIFQSHYFFKFLQKSHPVVNQDPSSHLSHSIMDHSMRPQGPASSSGEGPPGEDQASARKKKPTPRGQGKGKKAQKEQSEDEEPILSQKSLELAGPSAQVSPSEKSLAGKKKRVHRSKGSELRKKENRERRQREEREAAAAAVEISTAINSPPRSPSPNTVQPEPESSSESDTPIRDICKSEICFYLAIVLLLRS